MMSASWKTAITEIMPNRVRLRGYRIDELMGKITFAQAIFLALTGEFPPDKVAKLLDAIFVSTIDHGATPPSALAARTSASTGAPLNAAVAAGVLTINRFHGAAIEDCMAVLEEGLTRAHDNQQSLEATAAQTVQEYREAKKRIPGLGHRIHTHDPRTAQLFTLAEELGVAGEGVALLQNMRASLAAAGIDLPINVDGAIAALLIDLQVPRQLANAFFIIARVPGLVAHVHEEQTRERPMRVIHPTDHAYDGPESRNLAKE